jgi:phosphoglycolate phosphatase
MRTVFFDLDGTLTDPKPGIVRSIQYALGRLGRPVPEEAALLWCIGPPLRSSFVELLEGEAQADRAVELYRERFGAVGLFENQVYPGIRSLLETLGSRGWALHVATSKPHVYARQIVEHFELMPYFGEVFGSELSGERADKSDLLAHALRETGASSSLSVMIGDRSHDMIGAARNGVGSIGVLYGYGSREELVRAGARTIVERVEDVSDVLGALI